MAPKRLIENLPFPDSSSEAEGDSDLQPLHEEEEEEEEESKEEDDPEIDNNFKEDSGEEKQDTDEEQEHHRMASPKYEDSFEKNDGFVSDSDSEKTQSSPTASAFTIKPILRKPSSGSSKFKKSLQNHSVDSGLVTVAGSLSGSVSKRPAEGNFDGVELNNKKKKVVNGEDEEGKKAVSGSGINRLWSENDEISILQGMIDFRSSKGSDPSTDMGLLYDFIKKNLSIDVSKNQLIDKIRRLKKKYKNNVERGENGGGPFFSKAHEHKSFELSKKVWDDDAKKKPSSSRKQSVKVSNSVSINSPRQDKIKGGKKEAVNVESESKIFPDEFLSDYPWLKASLKMENDKLWSEGVMCLVTERMPLIGIDKAKELDEKWRKLGENELELYLKKVELVREQCKLVLDSVGKAKS